MASSRPRGYFTWEPRPDAALVLGPERQRISDGLERLFAEFDEEE